MHSRLGRQTDGEATSALELAALLRAECQCYNVIHLDGREKSKQNKQKEKHLENQHPGRFRVVESQHHQRHLTEPGLFSISTPVKARSGAGLWWGIPDAFSAGLQVALQGPPPLAPPLRTMTSISPWALGRQDDAALFVCSYRMRRGSVAHCSRVLDIIPFSLKGVYKPGPSSWSRIPRPEESTLVARITQIPIFGSSNARPWFLSRRACLCVCLVPATTPTPNSAPFAPALSVGCFPSDALRWTCPSLSSLTLSLTLTLTQLTFVVFFLNNKSKHPSVPSHATCRLAPCL